MAGDLALAPIPTRRPHIGHDAGRRGVGGGGGGCGVGGNDDSRHDGGRGGGSGGGSREEEEEERTAEVAAVAAPAEAAVEPSVITKRWRPYSPLPPAR